jgi:hypothetical protein
MIPGTAWMDIMHKWLSRAMKKYTNRTESNQMNPEKTLWTLNVTWCEPRVPYRERAVECQYRDFEHLEKVLRRHQEKMRWPVSSYRCAVVGVQLSVCTVQLSVYSYRCALCSCRCTVIGVHCAVVSVQLSVCTVQLSVCSYRCALCSCRCAVIDVNNWIRVRRNAVAQTLCQQGGDWRTDWWATARGTDHLFSLMSCFSKYREYTYT